MKKYGPGCVRAKEREKEREGDSVGGQLRNALEVNLFMDTLALLEI